MTDCTVHWNIEITKATDETLRTFLAGYRSGSEDFAGFVEEAVWARIAELKAQEAHASSLAKALAACLEKS